MEEETKKGLPFIENGNDPVESKADLNQPSTGLIQPLTQEDIDEDSAALTTYLSNLTLNEQQKKEVKKLLDSELNASVDSLKSEVKREGQEIKKDFLIIFGLFASFVTFLSIEVQVFKNKDNIFELIGISAISISLVIFFALVINNITKDKGEWKDFIKPSYIINLTFTILGIVFLYLGGKSSSDRIDQIEQIGAINTKQIEQLNSQLVDYADSLKKLQELRNELSSVYVFLNSLDSIVYFHQIQEPTRTNLSSENRKSNNN